MNNYRLAHLFILLVGLMYSTSTAAIELAICAKAKGQPKHYLDSSGKPKGYAVEIAAEAVHRSGYKPNVKNVPWKRAQKLALAGHCLITAFSVTEERKVKYLFSDSMFVDRVLLWQSVERTFPFRRFEDLIGKLIGIPVASHYSGAFNRIRPKLRLYEDMDNQLSLNLLIKGRLDAAIFPGDIATVKYIARKQGLDFSKIEPSKKPISLDPNHIGIPRKLIAFSPKTILKQLNTALALMKSDGTIATILNHYR